ncbi:MAG: 3'(2'),5'-bisphosphate nucleotidase CysQ [Rickettsiales bacterium]|nr:3'(2'),5'-bisphosphate nucleotidase CysQ [Rickettsiales bacterium]
MQHTYLLNSIINLSLLAGEILLNIRNSGDVGVEIKQDKSPVTEADKQADKLISEGLAKISNLPIISEEGAKLEIPDTNSYWLVDPLDGTKAFIRGENDFTVNIGLVIENKAVMGVVFQPAENKLYFGEVSQGAFFLDTKNIKPSNENNYITISNKIEISNNKNPSVYRIVASKSHLDPETKNFIDKFQPNQVVSASSSLKFCIVAEGGADIYPRFGPTMQWDTCAGQAVLVAAGGRVTHPDNSEFLYKLDKEILDYLRNGSFIAWGVQILH